MVAKEDIDNKRNNMKLKNLLMGIADLKINPDSHTDEEWIIWMDQYVPDSDILRLPCNQHHYFHRDCILKWIESNPTCPLCKTPVTSDAIENQPRDQQNNQENNQNRNADANLSVNRGNQAGYRQLDDEN